MARVNIWETVVDGSGRPITGATVDVWLARTTTDATIFAAESGGGTLSNPVTTTNGVIPGWVDESELDLHVTGVGITETTKRFNAIVGGNPLLGANSVGSSQIQTAAVSTDEIADGSVTSAELAAAAVTAGKIAVGGISAANQHAAGVVDNAALGAAAVTSAKLGAASVTAGKIAAGAIDSAGLFVAGVVDAAAIAADAVGNSELANDAVANANVQQLTINPNRFNFNVAGNYIGAVTGTGGDIAITTTYQNLTSITASIATNSDGGTTMYGLFWVNLDISISAVAAGNIYDETVECRLTLNGTDVPGHSFMRPRMKEDGITGHYRCTIPVTAGLNLSAAGPHTVRPQVKIVAGDPDTDSVCHVDNCSMQWLILGSA